FSYGDRRAAFELCWRMSSDGGEILSRAFPDREAVAADYVQFLLTRHEVASLAPAALKLARLNTTSAPQLNGALDLLLESGMYSDAVAIWEAEGKGTPKGIADPNLQHAADGHGF